jgi:uncharacterized damage-inducible protein DinB
MDVFETLLQHDHWATSLVLQHMVELNDANLDKPFDLGHGSIRDTLSHHLDAIEFWMGLMTGVPGTPQSEPKPAVNDLIDRHNRAHGAFADFVRSIRDEGRLDETFVDHHGNESTFGNTFLHVILHSSNHRAEERHMLQRLGVQEIWDADPQEWGWANASG